MYKYQMKPELKRKCKLYANWSYVDYKSYQYLVSSYGFPKEYVYWHVLGKLLNFVFYSKAPLKFLYVNGYPVDVKFFEETVVS